MFESGPAALLRKALLGKGAARRRRGYPAPVTAIEVDGSTLRVVCSSSRGQVTRVAAEPLTLASAADRTDPEALGKAIAEVLGRLRLLATPVVMGVPRASVLLRSLSLPAVGAVEEIAAMVHLQVSKDLPFRLDEAVVDFKVRTPIPAPKPGRPGSDAPPKVEVLVAVVKREVVEFYRKTALAARLKLIGLGLLSYANARCLEACRLPEEGGGLAIITLRPDEVGIDLVARDWLLFSRGASLKRQGELSDTGVANLESTTAPSPVPAAAPIPAETGPESQAGFVEAVLIEVVRSLHSFGGLEARQPVSKLVVAGATGHEPAVAEALQARLSLPCTVLPLAKVLNLPPDTTEAAAGSMSGVGLALGASDEEGLPFDFLSPRKPAVRRDARQLRLLLGALALLAVVLFLFVLRSHLVNQRLKVKLRLTQEVAQARKQRRLYEQMRQQLATLTDWTQGGRDWLEHYAYLSAVLPPSEEVYVTSLSISGSGAIRLAVQARSGQVLAKLDKQLRAAGYDVKPLAITPGEEKLGYDFRSTVELEVPAKMAFDLTKVHPPPRPADDGSLDGVKKGGAP
jgi:Tfp pilus assembly PilM family ATPase